MAVSLSDTKRSWKFVALAVSAFYILSSTNGPLEKVLICLRIIFGISHEFLAIGFDSPQRKRALTRVF